MIAAETVFYFGLCFDRTLVAAVMIKGEAEIAQLSAPVLLVDFKLCMSPFRGCLPYAMFVIDVHGNKLRRVCSAFSCIGSMHLFEFIRYCDDQRGRRNCATLRRLFS